MTIFITNYQHYKICPDCGKVYVDEATVQDYMWCEECCTANTWAGYLQQWLPVSTFPDLANSTEYQSVCKLKFAF